MSTSIFLQFTSTQYYLNPSSVFIIQYSTRMQMAIMPQSLAERASENNERNVKM